MNELMSFIQDFVASEYALSASKYTERDVFKYIADQGKVKGKLIGGLNFLEGTWGRGFEETEEFWEAAPAKLAKLEQRDLFAAFAWRHADHGDVVTALASGTHVEQRTITYRLHAAKVDEKPLIVAIESFCTTCGATGSYQGAPCGDCAGVGWIPFAESRSMGCPGELSTVHKLLEAPDARSKTLFAELDKLTDRPAEGAFAER